MDFPAEMERTRRRGAALVYDLVAAELCPGVGPLTVPSRENQLAAVVCRWIGLDPGRFLEMNLESQVAMMVQARDARDDATGAKASDDTTAIGGADLALSNYIPAKDCRNGRIRTHKMLMALLQKGTIRHESRGQRLHVHAADWLRWNAEQDRLESEALEQAIPQTEQAIASIRAEKISKKLAKK